MSTLYENLTVNDDGWSTGYDPRVNAQTFTPSITHRITEVKILAFGEGSPGTITIGIRATSGGHPSGGDLCSGTFDGGDITTNTAGEWVIVSMGAGYILLASVQYAMTMSVPSGDTSNNVRWRRDNNVGGAAYGGGTYEYASTGANWTTYVDYDQMFEDRGDPLGIPVQSFMYMQRMRRA